MGSSIYCLWQIMPQLLRGFHTIVIFLQSVLFHYVIQLLFVF